MRSLLFILCMLVAQHSFSQQKKFVKEINDFTFVLHEESVNKILGAVGDIKGTNDYEVMLIKGKYHWTIQNSKINIRPDSSQFTCDALVNVGPVNYKTQVVGDVKITYDEEKNIIYLKISRAIFELYTIMFSKKFHIKDIHLEEYFSEPFAFEGPRTIGTDMDFTMPDSTIKKIYVQPTECRMQLKWKEICTSCEIAASDKPIKPIIKVLPPLEGVKTNQVAIPTSTTVPAQKK